MRSGIMLAVMIMLAGCTTPEGPVETALFELVEGDPTSDDGFGEECADQLRECDASGCEGCDSCEFCDPTLDQGDVCLEGMDRCVERRMEDVCEREDCECVCDCDEGVTEGPQARERTRCRCRCRCRARIRGVCVGDEVRPDPGAHTETESETETETESEGASGEGDRRGGGE